jgi:hypothetical protein
MPLFLWALFYAGDRAVFVRLAMCKVLVCSAAAAAMVIY